MDATAAVARGGAALAGGASSYSLAAAGQSGASGVASGHSGVARAAAATRPVSGAASRASGAMAESYRGGARTAVAATGGGIVPFVSLQVLGLGIVWLAPRLATWLPKVIYGTRSN